MSHTKDREEFTALMTEEGVSFDDIQALMRHAQSYHTLQVRDCNYGLSEGEQKREERIQSRIAAICQAYAIKPIFSGDPRGATVKFQVPSDVTNDWGRIGICAPARG